MFIVHKSRVPKLGEKRVLMRDVVSGTLASDGHVHKHTLYPGDRVRVTGMNVQACHGDYVEVRELRIARVTDEVEGILTEETQSRVVW